MTKLFPGTPRDHKAGTSVDRLELKEEHDEIREHLVHLRRSLRGLAGMSLKEQRKEMDRVIAWLEEHIEHHTRQEDKVLYPMIERHAGTQVTATLRVEHRFIYKSFDTLRRLAAEPVPDPETFLEHVDNLIGLFAAHFDAEEEVLFPIVDQLRERGVVVVEQHAS